MPKAVEERIAAAKLAVMFKRPYFVTPLTAMQFVYEPRMPAILGVDKWWRCYVNPHFVHESVPPDWLMTAPIGQVCFGLLHELEHLLHDHEERRTAIGGDHAKFNIAGDLSINSGLRAQTDLERPPFGVFPDEYPAPWGPFEEFLMTEVYYAKLPDPEACQKPGGDGAIAGECGSGAGNQPGEWELGAPGTNEKDPRSKDAPGVDEISARLVRETTAHEIQKAARDAEQRGTIPTGLERWAEQILRPKVDWRRQLPSKISGGIAEVFGKVSYTYTRPSRRAAALPGIILPAMRQPVPNVDLIIDSSGSIDAEQLTQAVAECHGLLLATGGRKHIRVLSVDAQVGRVQRITSARDIRILGGGGTDMRVGFAAVEALRPRSDMTVMITDCYTPWPDVRPRIGKIVIVAVGEHGAPPEWEHAFVRVRRPQDDEAAA